MDITNKILVDHNYLRQPNDSPTDLTMPQHVNRSVPRILQKLLEMDNQLAFIHGQISQAITFDKIATLFLKMSHTLAPLAVTIPNLRVIVADYSKYKN